MKLAWLAQSMRGRRWGASLAPAMAEAVADGKRVLLGQILLRALPTGGFARSVATLTGATAFSQALGLLAMPMLTRLYLPSEFGAAAAFAAVVGLVTVIAALRYEIALPLPRTDLGALHLAAVAFMSLCVVALIAGVASPFLYDWLGDATGLTKSWFGSLMILWILTVGCYQITTYWAIRKSKFTTIGLTRIQQGIAWPTSQLAMGFAGFGAVGLILGQILGQWAGLFRLANGMAADNRGRARLVKGGGLRWAAWRYRRFPLYDCWSALLNTAGAQAPALLFAALFSPALAGYYALAYRLLSAPLSLIGDAVSQALMPRIIEAGRRNEAGPLTLRLLTILAWLSFFPFTVAALLAHDLVPLIFGAQWTPAGEVVAWTALWVSVTFVVSPLSVAITGLEAQRLHTIVQFLLFALRVGGILVGAAMASPELAVIGFTLASILGYAIYLVAIGRVTGIGPKGLAIAVAWPLILSGLCAYLEASVAPNNVIGYTVILAFGVLWIWILSRVYRQSI